MLSSQLALGIGAATIAGWCGLFAVVLLRTRPRAPHPEPVGDQPELGPEPPAVVNLLANRWRLTGDAAEATLLDLAARGLLELRQAGDDPMETTVHPREVYAAQLLPYERRVLDRVRKLATGGEVPITALAFRNDRQAGPWDRALRDEVVADARARGLSRRRFTPAITGALTAAAAVAGFGPMLLLAAATWWIDPFSGALLGFSVFAILFAPIPRIRGERDTVAGRAAAGRWLGVRGRLHAEPELAQAPPSSVHVWQRRLAYGAALGVTHTASSVLDLGMGDHRLVWSRRGGAWHRVRVHYPPRFLAPHLGQSRSGLGSVIAVPFVIAGMLTVVGLLGMFTFLDSEVASERAYAWTHLAIVVLLALYGLYALVRGLIDLASERTVTGEVLWVRAWRKARISKNPRRIPYLHYLVVDSGEDPVRAWGAPSELARHAHPGDTVRIRVRPWTRRVIDLRVVERGPRRTAATPATGGGLP